MKNLKKALSAAFVLTLLSACSSTSEVHTDAKPISVSDSQASATVESHEPVARKPRPAYRKW